MTAWRWHSQAVSEIWSPKGHVNGEVAEPAGRVG